MSTESVGKTLPLRREKSALTAGALTNGPAELTDFLIPLWAGAALEAGAAQIGIVIAAELPVSVLVRSIAGHSHACE